MRLLLLALCALAGCAAHPLRQVTPLAIGDGQAATRACVEAHRARKESGAQAPALEEIVACLRALRAETVRSAIAFEWSLASGDAAEIADAPTAEVLWTDQLGLRPALARVEALGVTEGDELAAARRMVEAHEIIARSLKWLHEEPSCALSKAVSESRSKVPAKQLDELARDLAERVRTAHNQRLFAAFRDQRHALADFGRYATHRESAAQLKKDFQAMLDDVRRSFDVYVCYDPEAQQMRASFEAEAPRLMQQIVDEGAVWVAAQTCSYEAQLRELAHRPRKLAAIYRGMVESAIANERTYYRDLVMRPFASALCSDPEVKKILDAGEDLAVIDFID